MSRVALVSLMTFAVLELAHAADPKSSLDGDWFAQKVTCTTPVGSLATVSLTTESDTVLLQLQGTEAMVLFYSRQCGYHIDYTLERSSKQPLDLTQNSQVGLLLMENEHRFGYPTRDCPAIYRFGGPHAGALSRTTFDLRELFWFICPFGVCRKEDGYRSRLGFTPSPIPTLVVPIGWKLSDGPQRECLLQFQRKSDHDAYVKRNGAGSLEPWVEPIAAPKRKWSSTHRMDEE